MKRELLRELGLTEEAVEKVMAENGKDIDKLRADAAQKAQELEAANVKLAELGETVRQFDGVDVAGLRAQIEALRQKYDADTAKLRMDHMLETALMQEGAHNPKTVLPLLDASLIKMDGDKLLGLTEQLGTLKADAAYLFKETQPGPTVSSGMEHGTAPGADPLAAFTASARAAAGLSNE